MQRCGPVLRELRGTKTIRAIATELGISPSAWAMYENGERTPRDDLKMRIARYFNKTVQEIFYRSDS